MLTPLLLDFSDKSYPNLFKKQTPTSQQELLELQESIISSTNYFIKIYFPENFTQFNGLKKDQLQFNIPLDPKLNNQMRLGLVPSIGYGVNSCYKVEYWEWSRPFYPGQFKRTDTRIIKKQVYEEYWRIPNFNKKYFYDYLSWKKYIPRYDCPPKLTLIKSDSNLDSLIDHLEIINIISIKQDKQKFTNFRLVDDSLYWVPPFEALPNPMLPATYQAPESTVAIEWLGGVTPEIGTEYEVTYIKPLSLEDIVYIDDLTGKSVLTHHPMYNYSFPFNPVY